MTSSIFNFKRLAALWGDQSGKRSLGVGLAIGCACTFLAPVILRAAFFRPNFQSMALEALNEHTKILVIGSSRVFFGIDPSKYDLPLMTLAADYLDLSTAFELWEAHKGKVPGLKTLVVEFGLATLRYDTRQLEPYACYHLGLTGVPPLRTFREDFDGAVHRLLSPFFKWRLTPCFYEIDRDMTSSSLEPLAAAAGFIPTGVQYRPDGILVQRRQQMTVAQLAAQDPAVFRRNLRDGLDLIADANQHGLHAILLRFPKSPESRPLYLPEWDAIVEAGRAKLREDPRQLKYTIVDLNRDERFVAEDFRDPDHLNRRGAEHLSQILAPVFRAATSP